MFKKLSPHQIAKLSESEKKEYYFQAREYYGNLSNQLKNFEKKERIHQLILLALKLYPVEIIELNEMESQNRAVIYSANHSNSHDFPVLAQVIKNHFFIIADYTMQNDIVVDSLNKINGCIYLDRYSKKSGQNAFNQAVDGLNKGYSALIFPESTWDLLDGRAMLPRKWGDIKMAQATGCPIQPIALVHDGNRCYVKYGALKYVSNSDDSLKADKELYEEMVALRKSIWDSEEYKANHQNISYEDWLRDALKSYKYFDTEYEMRSIRIDDTIMPEDIQHIIEVGEEIRPTDEIVRRLRKSKINYRE